MVFYSKTEDDVTFDPDFQRHVAWDIPLKEGYHHETHNGSSRLGVKSLIESIKDFGPHALLVFGWNCPGHLRVIRTLNGSVPIWFRGDSTLLDDMPRWKKRLRKIWLGWVYRHVDLAFYVGSANKAYFKWSGMSEDQLIYAPHAVDNDFFSENDAARQVQAAQIKIELGIPDDARVFLFVGKLEPIKRPRELVDAFLSMAEQNRHQNLHLVLIGSGVLEREMTALFGDQPRVHFTGFINQSQLPNYYRIGEVICLPSVTETWGLVINEAMACGCTPVVSDKVGCAADLVLDNRRILPSEDCASWGEGLLAALEGQEPNPEEFISTFHYRRIVQAITKALSACPS